MDFTFLLVKPGQKQGQKSSSFPRGNIGTWNRRPCRLSLSSLAFFRNYIQKPAMIFKAPWEGRLSKESFIWEAEARSNHPSEDGGKWHSNRDLTDPATDHRAVMLSMQPNVKDRLLKVTQWEGKKRAGGKKCSEHVRAEPQRPLPTPCTTGNFQGISRANLCS